MKNANRVIDLAIEGTLMPAKPGTCSDCAVTHQPEQPHNQESLYWQYSFYRKTNGRWPTWADAMAHCSAEVKAAWTDELRKRGVEL